MGGAWWEIESEVEKAAAAYRWRANPDRGRMERIIAGWCVLLRRADRGRKGEPWPLVLAVNIIGTGRDSLSSSSRASEVVA